MNQISCPCEANVSNAARTGRWDDSTKAHIEQCAHCREIAGIAEWMGHIASMDALEAFLPDPEQVYFNARVAAIQSAGESALRPLAIAELVVRIAVILALAAGILWAWFGFRSLAASWLSSYVHLPQAVWISVAALATCLIALLFTRLAQPILIEE
jgi:hypothetical protein